jgi:inorganic pyrophosphatase
MRMQIKHSNPWHDVSKGDNCPDIVNAIIEIPKGSNAKYEMDKATGLLRLDRVLYSAMFYPANYGFIPQTLGEDHDPLDILVLSQIDLVPLCIVEARVIGVMRMLDQGEGDDKIIAVADKDMGINYINDITELPAHLLSELKNFFQEYKKLEKKTVKVDGFQSKAIAKKIIEKAVKDYKAKVK